MTMEERWTAGIGADGAVPMPLHAAFSACLLELVTLARDVAPDRLVPEALAAWRQLAPFDAAWWGEVAAAPPRNLLHGSIGLAASFADEWNRILAPIDTFAHSSMAQPGTVFRASGGYPGPPGIVADFIDRHGLHAIMAITVDLPASGVQFFIALYRHDPDAAFTDTQGALFAAFTHHLVRLWEYRMTDLRNGRQPLDAYALCDRDGRLLHVGQAIAAAIERHTANWSGTFVPEPLRSRLRRTPARCRIGGATLALEPAGDLVGITLAVDGGARASPRELGVAALYAQGLSYKEIARQLGLTPATVSTYLRDAYASLGVRNKVQLIDALGVAGRRAVSGGAGTGAWEPVRASRGGGT